MPDFVQGMWLVDAIPRSLELVKDVILAGIEKPTDITFDKICDKLQTWAKIQTMSGGKKEEKVAKALAVQKKGKTPKFLDQTQQQQQPQQQQQQGGSKKKGKKPRHRSKKGKQSANQAADSNSNSNSKVADFANMVIINGLPAKPAPTRTTIMSLLAAGPSTCTQDFGAPTIPHYAGGPFFPLVTNAVEKLHAKDKHISPQKVIDVKMAERSQRVRLLLELFEDPVPEESRPLKRQRTMPFEERISYSTNNEIKWESMQVHSLALNITNHANDSLIGDDIIACPVEYAVPDSFFVTNCIHSEDIAKCVKCKGKGKHSSETSRWMLDTGALLHFTPYKSNLAAEAPLEESISVSTMKGPMNVSKMGTVFLDVVNAKGVQKKIWLYLVYVLPGGTAQLLFIGQFLQNGFTLSGNSHGLKLYKPGRSKPFLKGIPSGLHLSTFIIEATLSRHKSMYSEDVFAADYDIIHCRLGHPSKAVLQKASQHTQGFPETIQFPEGDQKPCQGYAQGKMHAHPFPVTESRAKEPFEKIHSDLKEFPVESYHWFKYMITFLNDYMSHGWIKFLRWKSDTIKATCTFIAIANNRFKSIIKQ
jgi:hypothetical protein